MVEGFGPGPGREAAPSFPVLCFTSASLGHGVAVRSTIGRQGYSRQLYARTASHVKGACRQVGRAVGSAWLLGLGRATW